MAVKKPAKKPVKKLMRRGTKQAIKKDAAYKCSVCGLVVSVDEVCGCVDTCDIICCEKPMKPKRKTA